MKTYECCYVLFVVRMKYFVKRATLNLDFKNISFFFLTLKYLTWGSQNWFKIFEQNKIKNLILTTKYILEDSRLPSTMISRIISKRSRTQLRSLSILTPSNDDDTTPITKPLLQHHFPSRHQINHPTTTTLYTTTSLFNHTTPRPLHAPLISRAYFSTDNKKTTMKIPKTKNLPPLDHV